MKPKAHRAAVVVIILVLASGAHASWLSKITGVDINIPAGTIEFAKPQPQAIPEMLRNLPTDVGQAFLNPMGSALATAIRHAASQARYSSQPLPADVAEGLRAFLPPHVLGRARWTVYDPNRITIDSAISNLWGPSAITLDDVIVFRQSPRANRDWGLWAHELVHVGQYHNMGVEGFANLYSVAWNDLERPAYEYGDLVAARKASQTSEDRANLWSVGTNAFSQRLQVDDFSQAARAYYPPSSCVQWITVQGGAQITNICPVAIGITGWEQINPWNGYPFRSVCSFNCVVGPGLTKPFLGSVPGLWSNVFFRY